MIRIALAIAVAAPCLAHAQEPVEPPTAPDTEGPSRFSTAPYEPQLLRLLEVLGSVQFLRQLCGEDDGEWRDRAGTIILAEGDTDSRRKRMNAAFNRGYRAFDGYTSCTKAAVYAIDGYMREGEELSRNILLRYGE